MGQVRKKQQVIDAFILRLATEWAGKGTRSDDEQRAAGFFWQN